MSDEQMVYDGLTGNDADSVPEKIPTNADAMTVKIPDGVDAGGQGFMIDVETMDMDEGDGSEVLVEPGQRPAAPQGHPEIPTFHPANGNGNGVVPHRNGAQHAQRNGAQRNGAPQRNNRVAAYDRAAPYIQGTGAATMREGAQNFEPAGTSGPPNPAAFGWALGQADQQPSSAVDIAKSAIAATGQIGTAAVLARKGLQPPQFQPADPTQMQYGQQRAEVSYTPWLIGLGVLGVLGVGYLLLRKKPEPEREESPAPVIVRNSTRAKRIKKKFKKNRS